MLHLQLKPVSLRKVTSPNANSYKIYNNSSNQSVPATEDILLLTKVSTTWRDLPNCSCKSPYSLPTWSHSFLRYWPSTSETKIKNKQYAEQTPRQEHITASSESKNLRVNPFILKKLSWPKSAGLLVSTNEEELRSKLPLLRPPIWHSCPMGENTESDQCVMICLWLLNCLNTTICLKSNDATNSLVLIKR